MYNRGTIQAHIRTFTKQICTIHNSFIGNRITFVNEKSCLLFSLHFFYIKKYLVQISYLGFDASKALDGNRNQDCNGHICGHTAVGQKTAWWRLDIGQPANIYNIVIYYRNDCKY